VRRWGIRRTPSGMTAKATKPGKLARIPLNLILRGSHPRSSLAASHDYSANGVTRDTDLMRTHRQKVFRDRHRRCNRFRRDQGANREARVTVRLT
jgi:hypothetical protein